jgi:hypothetical protein
LPRGALGVELRSAGSGALASRPFSPPPPNTSPTVVALCTDGLRRVPAIGGTHDLKAV